MQKRFCHHKPYVKYIKNLMIVGVASSVILPLSLSSAYAAKPIDLSQQPVTYLQNFLNQQKATMSQNGLTVNFKETQRDQDFNQTTHARYQEQYGPYKVWGGDFIVHTPVKNTLANQKENAPSMNGIIYEDLQKDLNSTPQYIFSPEQKAKALNSAIQMYQKKSRLKNTLKDQSAELIIYINDDNKAQWAYYVSFMDETAPAKPAYILDAIHFNLIKEWNNLQTMDDTAGGGFGGNEKMGKLVYDGLKDNLPTLLMQRDGVGKMCYLQNAEITVADFNNQEVMHFPCDTPDTAHGNIFWDAEYDAVNGGYSPSNDALFSAKIIKEMYQKWYNVPVLVENGKPMVLRMVVHVHDYDNAYWDGKQMTFGDGASTFYPLVSLGVSAHEVSHGFTQQHSNLRYYGQSGGLNESYSDMAAQAAEYYAYGKNSWQIGPEIFKENRALRYMDEPTKDCEGRKPGDYCSISHMRNYNDNIDVHFTSGIFNKIFYLIGTAPGWNTKKAFDVMVQANMHYWTANTNFKQAACGVIKATRDYKYDMNGPKKAFDKVGISLFGCV